MASKFIRLKQIEEGLRLEYILNFLSNEGSSDSTEKINYKNIITDIEKDSEGNFYTLDEYIKKFCYFTNAASIYNPIGGIDGKSGDTGIVGFNNVPINEMLNRLLYPYKKPTIGSTASNLTNNAINVKRNGGTSSIFEGFKQITIGDITFYIDRKSNPITSIIAYRSTYNGDTSGNKTLGEYSPINSFDEKYRTVEQSGDTYNITYNAITISPTENQIFTPNVPTGNASTNVNIFIQVKDDTNNIVQSNNVTLNFVNPCYFGCINSEDTSTTAINKLNNEAYYSKNPSTSNTSVTYSSWQKRIFTKTTFNVQFTTILNNGKNQKPFICYPSSWGNISKIIDANGYNVTGAWTKSTGIVKCGSSGTNNISYNIYIGSEAAATAFNYTFSF